MATADATSPLENSLAKKVCDRKTPETIQSSSKSFINSSGSLFAPPRLKSPKARKEEIASIVNELLAPLKTELETANEEIRKLKTYNNDITEPLRIELNATKSKLVVIEKENSGLKEKLQKVEVNNRKCNIKMWGFQEAFRENKNDCKSRALNMLNNIGLNIQPMAIEQAYRVGNKNSKYLRPIVVQFFHTEERNKILHQAQYIHKKSGIRIEEDFIPEIEKERRELYPLMMAIKHYKRENGTNPYRTSLVGNRLYVNNQPYTVKTLQNLPEEINVAKLSTPRRNQMVAFLGKHSPLSNFHKKKQRIQNKNYNCNEQFYMEKKALTFHDKETADKIMKCTDPAEIKRLGSNITNFSHDAWKTKKIEIMKVGLNAKFRQNEDIKHFLLNTDDTLIVEASNDRYWGAGFKKTNPKLWNRAEWFGKAENQLGELLMELRREFKRELPRQQQK